MTAANSVKLLPESLHTPREVYVVSVCVLMNNATRTCEKRCRERERAVSGVSIDRGLYL